ncbi:MAG TPA: hypothetical protein VM186_07900 [Planctomycetota bacterium]|nr:hypothetical protein [Planctomycetota bacterium]
MSILSKVMVLINLGLGIAFLAVSVVLFSQQQDWKGLHTRDVDQLNKEIKQVQQEVAKRNETIKSQENEVTKLQGDLARKDTQILEMQGKVETAEQKAVDAKRLHDQLNSTFEQLAENTKRIQNEAESTRERLEKVQADLQTALQEKTDAQSELVMLNEQMGDLKLNIETLTKAADEQQKKTADKDAVIAAYKKAVPSLVIDRGTIVPPQIEAKIEEVDDQTGIVVLSVGSEDLVEKGFTFFVYRDDSYIGQVEVDRVFAAKSAARINRDMTPSSIQPGDGATTRLGAF